MILEVKSKYSHNPWVQFLFKFFYTGCFNNVATMCHIPRYYLPDETPSQLHSNRRMLCLYFSGSYMSRHTPAVLNRLTSKFSLHSENPTWALQPFPTMSSNTDKQQMGNL
jgi:hypothetical protein